MKLYQSYLFKTKDPVLDQLRTLVQDTYGKVNYKSLKQIEDAGGPSVSCMHLWFFGKTLRPQNPTVEAAGRAMGYHRVWLKMKGNNSGR